MVKRSTKAITYGKPFIPIKKTDVDNNRELPNDESRKYGYILHLNYPEMFPISGIPDEYWYKTHLSKLDHWNTVVVDANGELGIYFCPIAPAFWLL